MPRFISQSPEAVVGDVYYMVDDRLKYLDDFAKDYRNVLSGALANIGNIKINKPAPLEKLSTPTYDVPSFNQDKIPNANFSNPQGYSYPADPDLSLLESIDTIDELEIPKPPEVMAISLPSEPSLISVDMPVKPNVENAELTIPDTPTIVLPDVPELERLTIPTFTWEDIEDFEAKGGEPNINEIALPNDTGIVWQEDKERYRSALADRLESYFMGYLDSHDDFGKGVTVGATGLPASVENALFYRAKERQSDETKKAIDEATTLWASRGFSMPQGMLAKTIEGIKSEDMKRTGDLNRDIFSEAAKIRIEQLKFVIEQGLALESQKRQTFADMLGRLFEVAKYLAEAQMRVFNSQVSLFNIRQDAYRLQFEVYKTKIEAKMTKLQAYKTAIDGQVALGQVNQQYLDVYKTKVQALMSHIEVYKSQLQATQIQSDLVKNRFEMYRTEVQAYSEQMNTNKNLVDLYDSRVKAEVAKGNLSEIQAKNYASLIQGISSQADIKLKNDQMKLEQVRVGLQAFGAKLDLTKAQIQSEMNIAQQETARYQAQVEAWRASKGVETVQLETKSKYADMVSRTNIAYSQMQISKYQADMEVAKQEAMLALEASKAAGQYASQLAAGAMSAAHISASLSGSGSLSASKSTSESTSHSYSY